MFHHEIIVGDPTIPSQRVAHCAEQRFPHGLASPLEVEGHLCNRLRKAHSTNLRKRIGGGKARGVVPITIYSTCSSFLLSRPHLLCKVHQLLGASLDSLLVIVASCEWPRSLFFLHLIVTYLLNNVRHGIFLGWSLRRRRTKPSTKSMLLCRKFWQAHRQRRPTDDGIAGSQSRRSNPWNYRAQSSDHPGHV